MGKGVYFQVGAFRNSQCRVLQANGAAVVRPPVRSTSWQSGISNITRSLLTISYHRVDEWFLQYLIARFGPAGLLSSTETNFSPHRLRKKEEKHQKKGGSFPRAEAELSYI